MKQETNKVLKLARKLKALAERGEGGEKENAKKMLDAYLAEHNLEMSDIEDEPLILRDNVVIYKQYRQLFINLIANIAGHEAVKTQIREYRDGIHWQVKLTEQQWIEYKHKWVLYRRAFEKEYQKQLEQHKKEQKLLMDAFISRNGIYSSDSKPVDRELTREELMELMEMIRIREGIEKTHVHRTLKSSKT